MTEDQFVIAVEQAGERWVEDQDDKEYLDALVGLGFTLAEATLELAEAKL